jgi:carbon-monoxide dehydrogenase medium subunit
MLALDASIHLKGPKGSRVVKASDFFSGPFTVDLGPDEIITAVRFRPIRTSAYAKLHQRASHFAIVGVAAAVEIGDGVIRSARIGLTGAASSAVRLSNVEKAVAGQAPSARTIDAAVQLAGSDLTEINSDIHASADYRRAMIPVFTRRALERALATTRNS